MARLFLTLIAVLGLGFTACQPTEEAFKASSEQPVDQLFSNKPQMEMVDIAIIKLRAPALLPNLKVLDGNREIDQELLAQINKEQDELVLKLADISPELEVVYRYHWLVNAVAFVLPPGLKDQVGELADSFGGELIPDNQFGRPQNMNPNFIAERTALPLNLEFGKDTTVDFIGASRVHKELGITGKGVTVGIIDTGIDYTHAAFGGAGTVAAYAEVDPKLPSEAFPSPKVVGGYDFVGTDFGSKSMVPEPDLNPIDEAGHGTHVAATVAGIGDDENVYGGVAPGAELYALKVFGAAGGTGDIAVIAALEYSVDPNKDFVLDDQLDVVNLSLGSDYGQPHTLYQEAIRNLVEGGTFVVAAAGNSGHVAYIVGSPSTADSALSVAASIDNLPHNIQFATVAFEMPSFGQVAAEATEGPISRPIASGDQVEGKLVYVGLAKELTEEQQTALAGQVALVDRGEIAFFQKLSNVKEAGAIGAVVINNVPGEPSTPMGGEDPNQKVDIPAVMVTFEVGTTIKSELEVGDVSIRFQNEETVLKPELVDTLTSFSSIGPRSEDSLLKPEIAAPGSQILSAEMGSGNKGVMQSGTSMAAPHMAGVVALLKEVHPILGSESLKSLVMSTAKTMSDPEGDVYSVNMQGAGRVQAYEAVTQKLLFDRPSFSLGALDVQGNTTLTEKMTITNLSGQEQQLRLESHLSDGIRAEMTSGLTLASGESKEVVVTFVIEPKKLSKFTQMGQGFLGVLSAHDESLVAKLPVLSVLNRNSRVEVTSQRAIQDGQIEIDLTNNSPHQGPAYFFNLINTDARKENSGGINQAHKSVACDLQSAGYRIIEKLDADGNSVPTLQIAAQLYDAVTMWKLCEISVQFDSNGDGEPEQELGGIHSANLGTLGGNEYISVLLDAPLAKLIRARYEFSAVFGTPQPEDYLPAIQAMGGMTFFDHSTLSILEVPLAAVQKDLAGNFSIQIATLHRIAETVEPDDFLGGTVQDWTSISSTAEGSGYFGMAESTLLQGGETKTLKVEQGAGIDKGIVYFPANARSPEAQSTLVD